MFSLNRNVRLVTIQFRLSNEGTIPPLAKSVPESSVDTEKDLAWSNQNEPTGELVIPSTQNVDVSGLLLGLAQNNYVLTNLVRRRVQNGWLGNSPVWVHILQYRLTQSEFALVKDAVKGNFFGHLDELAKLLRESNWMTMGHLNPFTTKGQSVLGTTAVNFSLTKREPKYDEFGQPLMRWINKNDKSLGKTPFKPTATLKIVNGIVSMEMTANETASAQE